jgi:predicted ATPase/DNA-binding CsgD family transcriptional regulator
MPAPHLFVSYASADHERVERIVAALERAGISVWQDKSGIPGGANYGPEIVGAIRESAALLLICSPASYASRNVRQEVALAWKHERPILPVLLDRADIPDELAYWLEAAQWIELLDRSETAWLPDLRRALERVGVVAVAAPQPLPAKRMLPRPRTPLVGRASELVTARAFLVDDAVPLLTLSGAGGVGKTRLALAIGQDLAGSFADGALFVDLSPIRDPALVIAAIAQAADVRESAERPLAESLAVALRSQQLLMVLDNCEQVLAAAPFVADLLDACPALQILATSRAPLRIRGEQMLPVPPLALPESTADAEQLARVDAVALFVQRARAANPSFALTDGNAAAVAAICRRVDGLPLALELAAARLRLLSIDGLATHLDQRLGVLAAGERDLPGRHQALRATIAWSYDLLDDAARVLFAVLGVFAGGFDATAAAAVTGRDHLELLDGLGALIDQSLLRRQEQPGGGVRFGMLEIIRDYALESLTESGQAAAIRNRHLAWAIATVQEIWPSRATAPVSVEALGRLVVERDNLRAALTWAIESEHTDAALQLTSDLAESWSLRGEFSEGRAWLERALALPGGVPMLRSSALYAIAALEAFQGDPSAPGHAAECLRLAHGYGDTLEVVRAHFVSSFCNRTGSPAELEHAEAGLALARQVGDKGWIGYLTLRLGDALGTLADYDRAVELHRESARLFGEAGDRWGEMNAVTSLANNLLPLDRSDDAEPLYRRGCQIGWELDSPWGILEGLAGVAVIASERGDMTTAAHYVGVAEGLAEPIGFVIWPTTRRLLARATAAATETLGDEEVAWQRRAGRSLARDRDSVQALILSDQLPADSPAMRTATHLDAHPDVGSGQRGLSTRELEMLRLLTQRLPDQEIAARLTISTNEAGATAASLFRKLGVANRREATALAVREAVV